jgi:glycosyltransferase involved in cell wall biosynthesis
LPDIVLDVRCLQDPAYARRGIGRHALALLRGARADKRLAGARLLGLADPHLPSLLPEAEALLDGVRTTAYTGALTRRTAFVQLSPMTHDPLFVARLLHGPAPVKAAVVYDFIPLDAPDRYLGGPEPRLDYETRLRWLRHHDLFLPISEATATRLRVLLGSAAAEVAVTGAPLDPAFITETPGSGRHLLVVGGEVRKNPECAVRAHARSAAMQERRVPLIVLGQGDPAWIAEQRATAAGLGGRPDLVQSAAHVPEPELLRLYRDALCVIVPSRDEGFSLPVIEAMASGVPVLASRIPAHEELLGDPATLFAPDDDGALAVLLDQAADPAWRAAQVAANEGTWRRFQAEAVAGRFWSAIADRFRSAEVPALPRGAKPRLAVLSPLPPARSGVADYTASMCAELGKRAEIHLFTEALGAPLPPGAASVAPLSALPFLDTGYDRVVGVVGNSDHHLAILRGLLRYGGAALCHDGRLLDVYNACLGHERAYRLAEVELGRTLAPGEMDPWLTGTRPPGALLFGELAEVAEPLMVHARATVREVRDRYGVEARYLPFCLYRPWSTEMLGTKARAAARERLGVPPGTVLLATFGFTSPPKAPEDALWALEQLRAWGVPARLHYVGQALMDLTPLRHLAHELGLAEHVDFGGTYVGERHYRDALLAADLAIQLRTLGPGSVSGALADCVAAGLPTVASAALADALDAPSYVRTVPDAPSPVLVAEAALALLDAAPRTHVELERQAYAASHGFDTYAVRLLDALGLDA